MIFHMLSDTIGFRNMETKSVTARIRTGSYRTKIPFESTDFKENGKENLLLISYPSTVPAVLVIRSSISVSRNVNICNSSIPSDTASPMKNIVLKDRKFFQTAGTKNPIGINKMIFKIVFFIYANGLFTMSANGISFRPKSI